MVERTTQRLVNKQYRIDCTPTWFANTIKEVKNKFHNNFVIGLKIHPLLYKGINLGFTTSNQKKARARTQMKAKGHCNKVITPFHHKFSMWQINNENCVKFVHSWVRTFHKWISCVENMFNICINVLTNQIQTYEWMNVAQISHIPINMCQMCF